MMSAICLVRTLENSTAVIQGLSWMEMTIRAERMEMRMGMEMEEGVRALERSVLLVGRALGWICMLRRAPVLTTMVVVVVTTMIMVLGAEDGLLAVVTVQGRYSDVQILGKDWKQREAQSASCRPGKYSWYDDVLG